DLGGYPVTLLDTAGVRESDDPVEQEGVRRARERAKAADLVLWVEDAAEAVGAQSGQKSESKNQWIIHNKADLIAASQQQSKEDILRYKISALNGIGVDLLVSDLARFAADAFAAAEPA